MTKIDFKLISKSDLPFTSAFSLLPRLERQQSSIWGRGLENRLPIRLVCALINISIHGKEDIICSFLIAENFTLLSVSDGKLIFGVGFGVPTISRSATPTDAAQSLNWCALSGLEPDNYDKRLLYHRATDALTSALLSFININIWFFISVPYRLFTLTHHCQGIYIKYRQGWVFLSKIKRLTRREEEK